MLNKRINHVAYYNFQPKIMTQVNKHTAVSKNTKESLIERLIADIQIKNYYYVTIQPRTCSMERLDVCIIIKGIKVLKTYF